MGFIIKHRQSNAIESSGKLGQLRTDLSNSSEKSRQIQFGPVHQGTGLVGFYARQPYYEGRG